MDRDALRLTESFSVGIFLCITLHILSCRPASLCNWFLPLYRLYFESWKLFIIERVLFKPEGNLMVSKLFFKDTFNLLLIICQYNTRALFSRKKKHFPVQCPHFLCSWTVIYSNVTQSQKYYVAKLSMLKDVPPVSHLSHPLAGCRCSQKQGQLFVN